MQHVAFVTGASGYIGRHVVRTLLDAGVRVRAGVRKHGSRKALQSLDSCDIVEIDICDRHSLSAVFQGVQHVYHFAAAVTSRASEEELTRINVEGTRNVWSCAAEAGAKKALYCSSTAVYGLLAHNGGEVGEEVAPRAVERYGRSKLRGEQAAMEISASSGLETVVIRPTAVFGPGEHTHFGDELRQASISSLMLGGRFRNRRFNFVHVHDVANAAVHLMHLQERKDDVYNIVAGESITYEDAFSAYLRALGKGQGFRVRQRFLGHASRLIERMPAFSDWLLKRAHRNLVFPVWRPGFDMTFAADRLAATDYECRWNEFEEVLLSCMHEQTEGV
ncbi:NAD-dependent epimerase/dehydratase family protein [bacterium]|nr:NAD-dependent epimerase/dehydratase family protein [bacterium]